MAHWLSHAWRLALISLACLILTACADVTPTPTQAPFPTALPTAAPALDQIIDGARFGLKWDGQTFASEEIHASRSDDEIVILSEIRYLDEPWVIERRTLVTNAALTPMRYDLERITDGVRSLWVAERTTRGTAVLSNHQALPAPILFENVRPDADLMLEAAPSALPYVLLALRYTTTGGAAVGEELNVVDVIEDLPRSRALMLAAAPDRTGAIIGTSAVEGDMQNSPNPAFTLWLRADARTLYGVEVPGFRANPWLGRLDPRFAQPGRLTMDRVSQLPEIAPAPPSAAGVEAIQIATSDGKLLAASLLLPSGPGPHPCLISLGAGDITLSLEMGDTWQAQGWATCVVDPRGTGASEGRYLRSDVAAMAQDALAVIQALAERTNIDPQRLVLIGMGNAGLAAGLALEQSDVLAGAVLGNCAAASPLIPDLAEQRISGPLSAAYDWSPDDTARYHEASLVQWQQWLFDGADEAELLRRRIVLDDLRAYAETDLEAALLASKQPVLLLHGQEARWPTLAEAQALAAALESQGRAEVSLASLPAAGDRLWMAPSGPLQPEAEAAIMAWLAEQDL